MINRLEPVNIVLLNIYFIMVLQLLLNWQPADCNTNSNLFQLAFILVMLLRIVAQQAYFNKGIKPRTYKAIMLFTSGCLLNALGIYESYTIAKHSYEFDYDPKTKIGNLACYQNRIVYVTEIIFCFLTILKDIVVVIIGSENTEENTA